MELRTHCPNPECRKFLFYIFVVVDKHRIDGFCPQCSRRKSMRVRNADQFLRRFYERHFRQTTKEGSEKVDMIH